MTDLKGLFSSTGGVLGGIGSFCLAAWWFISKMYRANSVEGANTAANIDMLAKYSEMLDKAYARAEAAEKVRDDAQENVNTMVREVGELKTQIATLNQKVTTLEGQLNGEAG